MKKAARFHKNKKGFTLVELITVLAIMAIATAMAWPSFRGMIDSREETKIQNYCVEATSLMRSYVNLLKIGETEVGYLDKNGKNATYAINTPAGLKDTLNYYNQNADFQYYVVDFDSSSATSNPLSTIQSQISSSKLAKNDVMIAFVEKTSYTDKTTKKVVEQYSLKGFWYYGYSKNDIVYSYYVPSRTGKVGFVKLQEKEFK